MMSYIIILLALRMQMLCEELGDLAALGKPQGIGWGNNEQTKFTMETDQKTKELVCHLSPRDGHVIIVSGCLILTAVNLIVLIRVAHITSGLSDFVTNSYGEPRDSFCEKS